MTVSSETRRVAPEKIQNSSDREVRGTLLLALTVGILVLAKTIDEFTPIPDTVQLSLALSAVVQVLYNLDASFIQRTLNASDGDYFDTLSRESTKTQPPTILKATNEVPNRNAKIQDIQAETDQ